MVDIKKSNDLPEHLFLYISSQVPMVNVDVLVYNKQNTSTLLAWRDDPYCGKGWHVPGGVLRIREQLLDRVYKVIETEIFGQVDVNITPIEMNELMMPELKERVHFISFLYNGTMDDKVALQNQNKKENDAGFLKWFDTCPNNLLPIHEVYRKYIGRK